MPMERGSSPEEMGIKQEVAKLEMENNQLVETKTLFPTFTKIASKLRATFGIIYEPQGGSNFNKLTIIAAVLSIPAAILVVFSLIMFQLSGNDGFFLVFMFVAQLIEPQSLLRGFIGILNEPGFSLGIKFLSFTIYTIFVLLVPMSIAALIVGLISLKQIYQRKERGGLFATLCICTNLMAIGIIGFFAIMLTSETGWL
ncbi:MAG: hypothetical protein A3D24_04645 [Candidatus Blackburnbacteria bacterium RIFCSPHIGHO2_02_FULL_39_13]|uniref:Uncharacterized protein n=1 Tax=Candidatus Blackburnbacteria bacterium RIFCSPLOWO2_01_FULL_40_20 TaxID=1797519 RepID=A0A1G1VD66_9BACT|nr:MAG: hypothetical protein A3D24_04645 [Candidatus Blackburnbacteria bacterium RIFCSPHIGHO2_02_FULL_39_13]OGY13335.1 MAG: hypothetical protein A3A77_03715 [Candidatus Blackburnbacteria bacterium RIFCSPLOWO2_01_FULL_40_20]